MPVSAEERVVPFRSPPSASLPALALLGDHDDVLGDGDNSDERDGQEATEAAEEGEAGQPARARILALLRTERRLEELELAIQEQPKTGRTATWMQREIGEAYEHELRTYDLLKATRPEWA